ncbi:MAG: hypothetical protein Q9217_001939 [Psora testacea]
MASKPIREGDSPSSSSILLPQLRHSRRGSLSSVASTAQLDKETISQALDLIHFTASHSDSLTAFNEYTSPPSSSSGPDSTSLTGEVQGGLSGLYNRLRASIENVKEIVNSGVEDEGLEKASEGSTAPIAASTASLQDQSDAVQLYAATSATGLGRPSPVNINPQPAQATQADIYTKTRLKSQGDQHASETVVERVALLKPLPLPLKQTATSITLDPAGKQHSNLDVEAGERNRLGEISGADVLEPKARLDWERRPHSKNRASETGVLEGQRPSEAGADGSPSFPTLRIDGMASVTKQSSSKTAAGALDEHLPAEHQSLTPDNVFGFLQDEQGFSAPTNPETRSKNQHLEIPLRKSLAPPLISLSESPRQSLSPVSSTDTNADTLNSVAHQSSLRQRLARMRQEQGSEIQTRSKSTVLRDPRTMNVFSQVKNKVLNKEYWMKDENARDCFYCGDPFSTFRRKHHCRTCGQIFDAKCTTVISGDHFSQVRTLRVCKPCEGIIKGDDDSSEFSDDGSSGLLGFRPRHGSAGAGDTLASPFPPSSPPATDVSRRGTGNPDLSVPMMSIPATRKAGERASRRPAVLEIGSNRGLARPSSSRSLKSVLGSKSHTPSHRRHNSRNQFQRMFRSANEDNAPFHQDAADKTNPSRLATFHDDNIIDPDLAPYLSEEASSGDEQVSIMAALNGDERTGTSDERHLLGGNLSRRARSRHGEKSLGSVTFASRDADIHSLTGSRSMNLSRPSKRRNFSTSSATHLRPSPRSYRANAVNLGTNSNIRESASGAALPQIAPSPTPSGIGRMIRSSSMRGAAAPTIELNNASLQHVRKLLHQLLTDSGISEIASWEKALVPILLRATDDVNPDVQNGDDIDIRHYVKLKKIPGARPGDTAYVSGLVFTKNLALKCMPRSIPHPNILILTFPLEYARHQQHFMSLEPVIRQEREFLQNLVSRIAALRPQLLLVERHVSGLALEFLEQAHITTAYNVKASVLEAVSRCCQTRIISSIDKLAIKPAQTGKCANFYLKTYLNEGRKKTYMFLSGCAKELGCTIVLRGANTATLKNIKRITEFMVYVVYNLKLETCLMRDEFALLPSNIDIGSMSPGADPAAQCLENKRADSQAITQNSEASNQPDALKNVSHDYMKDGSQNSVHTSEIGSLKPSLPDEDSMPDDVPMPTFYGDMVEQHRTKILSASPFVKFMQPYLLMRAREQERRLAYLKRLRDQDILETQTADGKPKAEKFDLITPEMVHNRIPNASKKVREVLFAVHDAEYDKAMHIYQTQRKQWETYIAGNINMFNPYAHQNIAVLYSVVCTVTTVPCSGPDLVALGFYNEHETDDDFEADCTLGQYVEDLCLGANTVCTSNGCEKKMIEHHRQYVHGEAQLSVFVERYPCKLRGLQNTILMWSTCRKCGEETQTMHMSENTWKYSFGKYLELSFWSSELKAQLGVCPHDVHRDHLRYFGFQDMAIRIHYDPIALLEIIVPRARITWKVDNDLRFKNEVFSKIEERLNKFMCSVKTRIKSINAESVLPEKTESCKKEIERLAKKAFDDHHNLVHKIRERYMNSKHYEIIPLNQAIRATQEKVAEWDNTFSEFDRNFFPSEKDIRRLTTLQLKKIFLDRDDSVSSLTSSDSGSAVTPESANDKSTGDETPPALAPQTRRMSPDKAHDLLAAVVENDASATAQFEQHQDETPIAMPAMPVLPFQSSPRSQEAVERPEVRHLDLAVPFEHLVRVETGATVKSDPSDDETAVTKPPPPTESDPQTSPLMGPPLPKSGSSTVEIPHAEQVQDHKPSPRNAQSSGIPRPSEASQGGKPRINVPPPLSRFHSQPVTTRLGEPTGTLMFRGIAAEVSPPENGQAAEVGNAPELSDAQTPKPADRTISDRLRLSSIKASGISAHSMIPRSVSSRRKDSRVSHLAKHFEQLSREFEKERIKERRQRAAKHRQSRAYPMAASKPIVQIYRNVHEAVEEKGPSDEDILSSDPSHADLEEHADTSTAMAVNQISQTPGEGFHAEETTAENTETEEATMDGSRAASDVEGDDVRSDDDRYIFDDIQILGTADEHHALSPEEAQLDLKLDLPKHEKTSLMKMLTNFWAERSASGWQPLEYPLHATDHIFADSDIMVREDEPSSLIAFALGSDHYQAKLNSIMESSQPLTEKIDDSKHQDPLLTPAEQVRVEDSLLRPTGTHLKYQFSEGSAKMLCKVFYAEQFDAVRRKCGVSSRMVESLSRCMKWDSKGGKTKSVFLKTLDDRFVLKSLSPIETQAFLRFAPAYFRIMSESLFHELPSVIAKMLGFYQIIIKNPATGIEFNWFLLLMENLFYDRSPTRIFDLKGSMRNRRIQSTGEQNEVLLDENMVEFIYESPLFTREHSKKLLRASVWNDTLFLSRQNVMDYSLMIAIDENRKELVVGIIDCIRTYTWDKKLESWIKDRGKNRPTVTSPKEYKSRFREAMGRYVLQAPSCWHQFKAQQVETMPLRQDDPGDDKEGQVLSL